MVNILKITNSILALSLFLFIGLVIKKRKKIFQLFSKIPLSLWVLNSALLFWRLHFIPHDFSSRDHFGAWLIWWAKNPSWKDIFISNDQAPVFFWTIKLFSNIFKGVGFEFVAGLNIVIFFLEIFFVYLLILKLFENKGPAYFGTIFFAFSPILFTFSLTEDYTIMALFFSIQSLLFATLYWKNRDNLFLFMGIATSTIAAGSRPEYIFSPYFFLLFCLIFCSKHKKKLYAYLSLFFCATIPKTIVAFERFIESSLNDPFLHGHTYKKAGTPLLQLIKVLKGHRNLFIENLGINLQRITDPTSFVGIFLLFALISLTVLFQKKGKKNKRIIVYFSFFFLFLFFYYTYLHNEGFRNFKYLSTTLLPLIILASYGISRTYKIIPKSTLGLLGGMIIFFMLGVGAPLTLNNFYHTTNTIKNPSLYFQLKESSPMEYNQYKKLRYNNRIFRILNPKKTPHISNKKNTYFICNGVLSKGKPTHVRTFLFSMPFEAKVVGFAEMEELVNFYNSIPNGATVYVIQSKLGFMPGQKYSRHFYSIKPKRFKSAVLKLFSLEQRLVSFYKGRLHVYFYKMKKANDKKFDSISNYNTTELSYLNTTNLKEANYPF